MALNTMPNTVMRADPRFEEVCRAYNSRFPASEHDTASRVLLCSNADEIKTALQQTISAGLRPTVRSGGHCYEDFVANNPGGAIIDVNLHNLVTADADGANARIAPGAVLGDVYRVLYKGWGTSIPGGSCYRVGAGGHIAGGGYGLLSRLRGLTIDWVTGIDILTVDANHKVVERHIDKQHDADLFRASRGAGGGNFGIITNFHCAKLPQAPLELASTGISFSWADMTEAKLTKILTRYGDYWEGRGKDPDTWGLWVGLRIGPKAPNGRFAIHGQFCNPDGTTKDLSVLHEFFDRFNDLNPDPVLPTRTAADYHASTSADHDVAVGGERNRYVVDHSYWLDSTVSVNIGGSVRTKYKSAYMKHTFTPAECSAIFRSQTSPEARAHGGTLSINSYGGAINKPELVEETSIVQRNSVMKLQWVTTWADPAQDAAHIQCQNNFYTAMYTGDHVPAEYQGTPFGPRYEGCYMNYADAEMLKYSYWPQLYYGTGDHVPFLQRVKRRYDPNNIFHYAMSIRA
jgi:FAD/FMN-containing dehydrogenase